MKRNKTKKRQKCFWFAQIKDNLLFILPSGKVLIEQNEILMETRKEIFRDKTYYRIPKTCKRIAQSSIKRNAIRANILL